jgi:hypothetical protein
MRLHTSDCPAGNISQQGAERLVKLVHVDGRADPARASQQGAAWVPFHVAHIAAVTCTKQGERAESSSASHNTVPVIAHVAAAACRKRVNNNRQRTA